nr:hypothetical protein [Pandoravirus belohorizontensis]
MSFVWTRTCVYGVCGRVVCRRGRGEARCLPLATSFVCLAVDVFIILCWTNHFLVALICLAGLIFPLRLFFSLSFAFVADHCAQSFLLLDRAGYVRPLMRARTGKPTDARRAQVCFFVCGMQ